MYFSSHTFLNESCRCDTSAFPDDALTYPSGTSASCVCMQTTLAKCNRPGRASSRASNKTHQRCSSCSPPVLSSSIIIQLCLPLAVKTALDNSLRRRQLHRNILLAAVMSAGLQTRGHEHMAPRYRLGRRIHGFATASPIFSLPAAILLAYYGRPLPAGNPTCQPAQYSPFA